MKTSDHTVRTVLVHSPNWLGDVVMALPAFRAWRNENAEAKVFVLAKKTVAGIWKYVRDVDGIVVLGKEKGATKAAAAEVRKLNCKEAILLPHSFRSAWIVWRGGVKTVRGTTGQFRSFMIKDGVSIEDLEKEHQVYEYMRIMGVEGSEYPPPSAAIDTSRLPKLPATNVNVANSLVILPGAARGDSKRWPSENFASVARAILANHAEMSVVVCGTGDESKPCADVTDALAEDFSNRVANMCGKTSLAELAALLAASRVICCNDSGGMHLATAMGTPVVAIFGITDPSKTGPLGRSKVVAAKGYKVSRAIPRESQIASEALASVKPEEVTAAVEDMLAN